MVEKEDEAPETGLYNTLRNVLWYLTLIMGLALVVVYWGLFIDIDTLTSYIESWGPKVSVIILTLIVVNLFIRLTRPVLKSAYEISGGKLQDWKVLSKVYTYFVWLLTIIIIFSGVFGSPSTLGISIGILGAGLAFALQQPILSFSGWFLIMVKRPFNIGDRIHLPKEGILGDVDDITVFFFVLKGVTKEESQTGKSIIVPNSVVFQGPVENYSYDTPHVWESISVSVTYESDIDLAEKLIHKAAVNVAGEEMKRGSSYMRRKHPESVHVDLLSDEPKIRVEFGDSSIDFRVRIMCLPKQLKTFRTEIYKEIFRLFNQPKNKGKVDIAYPHLQVLLQDGKSRKGRK